MLLFDVVWSNLASPPVLCFLLGALAVAVHSDLKLPDPVFAGLSIYLMLSIGLRGGGELASGHLTGVIGPVLAALALSCAIPLWCTPLLQRLARLSLTDSASMAAHYGSVSALTFAAVTAMLDRQAIGFEGYAPALLAVMEVPAIVVAVAIAKRPSSNPAQGQPGSPTLAALREVVSSKSVVLLAGGIAIGLIAGPAALARVKPLFGDLFQGALCLFLLELGRTAALGAQQFRAVGARLAAFAVVMPLLHGALGVAAAWVTGLSFGGAIVLGTLAASASYIAAPAAIRLALPEANAAYTLTCSVAITFPFNIIIGLPIYQAMARITYG